MSATVPRNHRAMGTGNNEWYTPERHLELARSVMGVFDLDPASSDIAQRSVGALRHFTLADDGLTQEWRGRVWLNPPYGQPHIEHFVRKLVAELLAGRVVEAILLTHNYTDTAWFHHAAAHCDAVCFPRGRIRFVGPAGERASPTQGQAFFYFGPNADVFAAVFSAEGAVFSPGSHERSAA